MMMMMMYALLDSFAGSLEGIKEIGDVNSSNICTAKMIRI